jgi:hypothetical protein
MFVAMFSRRVVSIIAFKSGSIFIVYHYFVTFFRLRKGFVLVVRRPWLRRELRPNSAIKQKAIQE